MLLGFLWLIGIMPWNTPHTYSTERFQTLFRLLTATYLPIKYSTKEPLTMYPKGFLAATFCQKYMSKEKWLQPQQNAYG
jgi:hypothetical protein